MQTMCIYNISLVFSFHNSSGAQAWINCNFLYQLKPGKLKPHFYLHAFSQNEKVFPPLLLFVILIHFVNNFSPLNHKEIYVKHDLGIFSHTVASCYHFPGVEDWFIVNVVALVLFFVFCFCFSVVVVLFIACMKSLYLEKVATEFDHSTVITVFCFPQCFCFVKSTICNSLMFLIPSQKSEGWLCLFLAAATSLMKTVEPLMFLLLQCLI